jgi:trimeric autotransporter adhesin
MVSMQSVTAFVCLVAAATSQSCIPSWSPGSGVPGVAGPVRSLVRLPGSGNSSWLLVGGNFQVVGSSVIRSITFYDPVTRGTIPLGAGLQGNVVSILPLSNGQVLAGGSFSFPGGATVDVARWNGAEWQAMGTGFSAYTTALTQLTNGDVVASGLSPGLAVAGQIVRWNGQWFPLAVADAAVHALLAMPNGDLIAAGKFTSISGIAANHIARWDGTSWSPLGSGTDGPVNALTLLPNGEPVAGGDFAFAGGVAASQVARWNGTSWSAVGAGLAPATGGVLGLTTTPNGGLLATGRYGFAGGDFGGVARWDGLSWQALGNHGGFGEVFTAAALPNGDIVAGGTLGGIGGISAYGIAVWNGTSWRRALDGDNSYIADIARLPSGRSVLVGEFVPFHGIEEADVVLFDGMHYTALPGSASGGLVHAVAVMPNGDIVIGGDFTAMGGVPAARVARWNGTAWTALGSGFNTAVWDLLVDGNGDLLAAGGLPSIGVARWNGVAWSPVGGGFAGAAAGAMELAELPDGSLLAMSRNWIRRWTGTMWVTISPFGYYWRMQVLAGGDVVVRGSFGSDVGTAVQRWNGSAWTSLPHTPGEASCFLELPNGDLLAGFRSQNQGLRGGVVRLAGNAWVPYGLGVGFPDFGGGGVSQMLLQANGDLDVYGPFFQAGPHVASGEARLVPSCPASAAGYGAGCVGSSGPVVSQTVALPWLGATFAANTTGVPASSVVIGVSGLAAAAVPLQWILPQSGSACTLLATPDLLDLRLPVAGSVVTSLSIPNTPALIGQGLRHQAVVIEIGAGGIVAATSGNGLNLTIGTL